MLAPLCEVSVWVVVRVVPLESPELGGTALDYPDAADPDWVLASPEAVMGLEVWVEVEVTG